MVKRSWREFFDGRSRDKGRVIARLPGRVRFSEKRSGIVEGSVAGDTGDYETSLLLLGADWDPDAGLRATDISSECSCPVGSQCKHAVAMLIAWAADRALDPPMVPARPAPSKPAPAAHDEVPVVALAAEERGNAEEDDWLMQAQDVANDQEEQRGNDFLLALLEQDEEGWCLVPVTMKRRKTGEWTPGKRYDGWERLLTRDWPARLSNDLRPFALAAAEWTEDERWFEDACMVDGRLTWRAGASGAWLHDLLQRGRIVRMPYTGQPLQLGATRAARLAWQMDGGRVRLAVVAEGMPDGAGIIPLHPLWWVHGNELGQLTVDAPAELIEAVLAMPWLESERLTEAVAVLRRWQPDLPDPPGVPAAPIAPVPVLRRWRAAVRPGVPGCELALATFDYAGAEVPAGSRVRHRGVDGTRLVRDLAEEQRRLAELRRFGLRSIDLEDAMMIPAQRRRSLPLHAVQRAEGPELPAAALAALAASGWRINGGAVPVIEVTDLGPLQADLAEGEGGWFDLHLGTEVGGRRIDLVPLLTPLLSGGPAAWSALPTVAGPDGPAVLATAGDGHLLRVPLSLLERLRGHLLALFAREPGSKWKVGTYDAGIIDGMEGLGIRVFGADRLRRVAEALRGLAQLSPAPTPETLRAELRPYQAEGLAWLQRLRSAGLGGILADDMGLGKTVQAIAHLVAEQEAGRLDRPCLVVCPASLVGTWRRELERFAPTLVPVVLHGQARAVEFARIAPGSVAITTYQTLVRDIDRLAALPLAVAICDEAQAIKNAGSKAAQAVRRIDAAQHLCLTGTPLENHLGELHTQVSWVAPGLLGSRAAFDEVYCAPIAAGDGERAAHLRRRLAAVLLRRTKAQVATDLPPRSESVLTVDLGTDQRRCYETIRLAMDRRVKEAIAEKGLARSGIEVIEALLRLRQVCCDPALLRTPQAEGVPSAKLDLLADLLPTLVEDGRRILLFSQFTSFLDRIQSQVLGPAALPFLRLDGATRDRQALVDRFQAGDSPLFLISLKAGGTGLTLTAADTVILADPWWNPAVEAQAIDRAHRIGQQRPVLTYRLVAAGTIEEKVLALQARKKALADALYDDSGQSLGALTEDDLAALLAPMM